MGEETREERCGRDGWIGLWKPVVQLSTAQPTKMADSPAVVELNWVNAFTCK